MKLKYLGTAAAEGIPGMFCNCRVCKNAIDVGGKEIKTRSQALIDNRILIDFSADTYMHIINHGLDLRNIYNCIITHSHGDHLYPNDLWCRLKGMAHNISERPFNIYVTKAGYKLAKKQLGRAAFDGTRLKLHKISLFKEFFINDYRIIPLEAAHSAKTDPVIYIIEHGKKTLLYANDTGWFTDTTWKYLKNYARRLDMVSLDCTGGALKNWRGNHMSLDTNKETFDRLVAMGLCDKNTIAYVNHFSHNGKLTHKELEAEAAKLGFGAAYDGLEIEF